jgi:hypothetical protein
MLIALEHTRRLRGGSQPHLMRCSDGNYYVVKFWNNPQGRRILVNEWIATRLAVALGLPAPPCSIIQVPKSLIERSAGLSIQMPIGRVPCRSGNQFGSRYPAYPGDEFLSDSIPSNCLRDISNLRDFLGMLAFDKWTCNTDGRQVVFIRHWFGSSHAVMMIDNGLCFNGMEWNFPDAPRRSLYTRLQVYETVSSLNSFEPWVGRIEAFRDGALNEIAREVPEEWLADDRPHLDRMLECLWYRRLKVRALLLTAIRTSPDVFFSWRRSAVGIPKLRVATEDRKASRRSAMVGQ